MTHHPALMQITRPLSDEDVERALVQRYGSPGREWVRASDEPGLQLDFDGQDQRALEPPPQG